MQTSKNSNVLTGGWGFLKIVTARKQKMAAQMADSEACQQSDKGEGGVKMEACEELTAKDHGFGDIVTLNVGGKR